ncbi:MAG: phosphatase [Oscillospiraceae bacterium]|nr:phosphatase [Oscillospiraceae bacterium]
MEFQMSNDAKEARREYYRKWRAKNKDKQSEYTRRYWERKAEHEKGVQEDAGKDTD